MTKGKWQVGIDVGGTKILAGVFDEDFKIVARAKRKTRGGEADTVLERVCKTVREAVAEAGIKLDEIAAIGVSVPGPIRPSEGLVIEAPNLGWRNVNVVKHLVDELGCPAFLSNDVSAGTWGEYCIGSGKGSRNCLGVFVGTGIGGGIVIDGKLYTGSSEEAGEIGHICINPHGPVCGCGRHGCLEAFASRTAITREIWAAVARGRRSSILDEVKDPTSQIRSRILKRAYQDGDVVVHEALHKAAHFLGIGLGSLANILNPDRIVLGGGVVEAFGAEYIELVQGSFRQSAFESAFKTAKVVEAKLGDDAGIIGAALLADEQLSRKS